MAYMIHTWYIGVCTVVRPFTEISSGFRPMVKLYPDSYNGPQHKLYLLQAVGGVLNGRLWG